MRQLYQLLPQRRVVNALKCAHQFVTLFGWYNNSFMRFTFRASKLWTNTDEKKVESNTKMSGERLKFMSGNTFDPSFITSKIINANTQLVS